MKRRGIILFITLAVILLMGATVMLILQAQQRFQETLNKETALTQGMLFVNDMSEYLIANPLTPQEIFAGSEIPVTMALQNIEGTVTLSSAQNRLNINAYLKALQHDQSAYDAMNGWLRQQGYKSPSLLLAILLDTIDNDDQERISGSEIRLHDPRYQNGVIYPKRSLPAIIRVYRRLSGDQNATLTPFLRTFGFEKRPFDLNYATFEQLRLLYPDFPTHILTQISAHDSYYESVNDLPVPYTYRRRILTPRWGITPTLKSNILQAVVDYTYNRTWQGRLSFCVTLGKKPHISHITLSPLRRITTGEEHENRSR